MVKYVVCLIQNPNVEMIIKEEKDTRFVYDYLEISLGFGFYEIKVRISDHFSLLVHINQWIFGE